MQNYLRLYDYIHEYQSLVYDYYSKHAIAFIVTYYNLNKNKTVWDDDTAFSGSYERIGDLTGIRFNKILNLPVFYIEEISVAFDAREIGYVKDGETSFVIPSSYNFIPYPGDFIKLEQSILRPNNDTYPVYIVTGIEKSVNTDKTFWKLRVKVRESLTTTQLDNQVEDLYTFVEYTKNIRTYEDAMILANTLKRHDELSVKAKKLFDPNSGFYFI